MLVTTDANANIKNCLNLTKPRARINYNTVIVFSKKNILNLVHARVPSIMVNKICNKAVSYIILEYDVSPGVISA